MLKMYSVIISVPCIGYLNGVMTPGETDDVWSSVMLPNSIHIPVWILQKTTRMLRHSSRPLRYAIMNTPLNVFRNI